jgi:hypothetical protein
MLGTTAHRDLSSNATPIGQNPAMVRRNILENNIKELINNRKIII